MRAAPPEPPAALRVAHRVALTEAEGPGRRFALWVQGCALACPGCCNPELFPAAGGALASVPALVREVMSARTDHAIEGITIVGGEPLHQLAGVASLAAGLRRRGLGVIVFTGHTWGEARALPGAAGLLAAVDTLVCGRFDLRRREPAVGGRRFIGSRNQTLHHLSGRYADPARWRGGPALELRIGVDGAIELTGDPGLSRRLVRALDR